MKNRLHLKKLNNAGMSLVELLTAVVILAIVVAPFLHSYLTTAQTNSKARIAMNASNIAEDAMEEFEAYDLATLMALTDGDGNLIFSNTPNPTGSDFTLKVDGSYYEPSVSGLSVEIKLDPDAKAAYSNFNSMNVSDVLEIKPDACGLYAMLPESDTAAYRVFVARNLAASADSSFVQVYEDYFRTNLYREITINFTSRGNIAIINDEGVSDTIQHVAVSVDVVYTLPDSKKTHAGKKVLQAASDCVYTVHKDIYDNASSKVPFESIYVLYTPRFVDISLKDNIIIKNHANIVGNCIVMREQTGDDDMGLPSYKPNVILEENPAWGVGAGASNIAGKKSALNLRTNLIDEEATPAVGLNFALKFNPAYRIVSSNQLFCLDPIGLGSNTETAVNLLNLMSYKTADGRALIGNGGRNRIYSITVTVKRGTEVLATLSGTKTE